MKLTRRQLAAAMAPAVALAHQPAETPQTAADSDLDTARARLKANTETLAKIALPPDVEPAFQFKA